jgi:hypothetical protein
MEETGRREFLNQASTVAGETVVFPSYVRNMLTDSSNERINFKINNTYNYCITDYNSN